MQLFKFIFKRLATYLVLSFVIYYLVDLKVIITYLQDVTLNQLAKI